MIFFNSDKDRITFLAGALTEITKRLNSLETLIDPIEKISDATNQRTDTLITQIESLENRVVELEAFMDRTKEDLERIDSYVFNRREEEKDETDS